MNDAIKQDEPVEIESRATILLEERLKQLGYECISDSCERFTTIRFMPSESKRKEELSAYLE